MATGGVSSTANVTSKLKCGICLRRYRRPKLLPCFHTFCQACLQTLAGTSPSFPCPACRAPVPVPPGGVGAFQTNFYIEEDLITYAASNEKVLCDVCPDEKGATNECLQCKQKYCAPCRQSHDAFTVCRLHTIVPITDNRSVLGITRGKTASHIEDRKEEKCPRHPKHELILYCGVCRINVCMQCKLTSHEGHPTEDLADAGAKVKGRLQAVVESMNQRGSA